MVATSSTPADGLTAIAEAFLARKLAGADDPEVYQVMVHVGTDGLTGASGPPGPRGPGNPARCHVEDGPAISVSTAQMLTCTAS